MSLMGKTHPIAVVAVSVSLLSAGRVRADPPPIPPATPAPAVRADDQSAPVALDARVVQAQAKAEVAKAQAEKAVAEEKATAEKEQRTAAQQQLDDARAGKLIRYGVTAGLSIVAQTGSPADGTGGARQRSFDLTTMPYLVLAPAYWFKKDQAATYCASSYVDADEAAALAAAFERAKKIARLGLDRRTQLDLESDNKETRDAAEAKLDSAARELFDPRTRPTCWPTRFGVYVGRPADFTSNVRVAAGAPESKQTVSPTVSAGLAFIPNAYITVLVGASHERITVPADSASGTPEVQRRFVAFTIGLGGNLDLLGAIFN